MIVFTVAVICLLVGWLGGLYVGINYFPRRVNIVLPKNGSEWVASHPSKIGPGSRHQKYDIRLRDENFSYDARVESKPADEPEASQPNSAFVDSETSSKTKE